MLLQRTFYRMIHILEDHSTLFTQISFVLCLGASFAFCDVGACLGQCLPGAQLRIRE